MRLMILAATIVAVFGLSVTEATAQRSVGPVDQSKGTFEDLFRQFEGEDWPTPTDYRNASGAPGHRYWQQKVDYDIDVTLDEARRTLTGRETITYQNNSPDSLGYLWLLLDQQNYRRTSLAESSRTHSGANSLSVAEIARIERFQEWEGGFNDLVITGPDGRPLTFTITDSLLRIDLPRPLATGETFTFTINFTLPLPETEVVGGRSGYECFTARGQDGNCAFYAAQWFPRLAVYSDYEGWHNAQFLGSGEFALEFGDYDVSITVPADHQVGSTGSLQNLDILTAAQRQRLEQARTADEPVYIVTPAEAEAAERGRANGTRTWRFTADNVRDFAWSSSRKFIWDAMGVEQDYADQPVVMAMSFYPKEGRPLWDAYSTKVIAHTLQVYSSFSIPYPYATAQSIYAPLSIGGMEYPMITFNGARPVRDDQGRLTYTEATKNFLITVVIHEIGHTYFPMVINSDERQWTWMDEGINTFLQGQAEMQWDPEFPADGEPRDIIEYMVSQNQVPIMTQSDSLLQFGNNAYNKPATALVILRETVMGRELFDRAFREYARRWAFKRPTPYDFFRTMEESSGMDLDWFWRGWFYSTDHVDISLEGVTQATLESADPEERARLARERFQREPTRLTAESNRREGIRPFVDRDPSVRDFYNENDQFTVTPGQRSAATAAAAAADEARRSAQQFSDNVYRFTFRNVGGLVMPVILKLTYSDGTDETIRIPAEIWRRNSQQVIWQHVSSKTLVSAELDPLWETADADRVNNLFPRRIDSRQLPLAPTPPSTNRMRDSGVQVSPDSLRTRPAS